MGRTPFGHTESMEKIRMHRRGTGTKKPRSLLKKGFIALGLLLVFALLLLAGYILSRPAWHMLDTEKLTPDKLSLCLYDQNGVLFSCLYNKENRLLLSEELPEHVKNAFIAAEDARFYSHKGIDIIRICGAAWHDLLAGAYVEGASTITQQLIKGTHLSSKKVMSRKVDEAILSLQLERRYSKEEILTMYLNTVYFGGGYYGLETAARGYFGVSSKDLSLSQAALLAGVLKSPARYAPHLRPKASVGRRGVVLDLMAEYGFISEQEAETAKKEPLVLSSDPAFGRRGYYVDYALLQSCSLLGVSMTELLEGGYQIHTAMDASLQLLCEEAFSKDENFPSEDGVSAQGAICMMEASTGRIAALVGGRDQQVALALNRAADMKRQPGSVIKPLLVYAPALEAGYTAAAMLLDEQTEYADYAPSNASGKYLGWVTMRQAVSKSLNIPAVTLFSQLGIDKCKAFAQTLGLSFDRQDTRLALALGGFTYGVSPLELCRAYSALADGGVYHEDILLTSISDSQGNLLYRHRSLSRRVMSRGSAFILTSMLMSVAEEGTAKALGELNIPIAAKTGTTGDKRGNRDIWLAAYTREYAAVVWMGYDDGSHLIPPHQGGGSYPAKLMGEIFGALYKERTAPAFTQPPEVVRVRLDAYGLKQDHEAMLCTAMTPEKYGLWEYFIRGTEPQSSSPYWSNPLPPEDLTALRTGNLVQVRFTPRERFVRYLLYRENSAGYAVLLSSFSGGTAPITYTEDVSALSGELSYYVIPVTVPLGEEGTVLTGEASQKARIYLYTLLHG